MDNTFHLLLEDLRENALKEFHKTATHQLAQAKLDQMEMDCHNMLQNDERAFAEECFDLLLDIEEQKAQFLYKKGALDGIQLLKHLGVL